MKRIFVVALVAMMAMVAIAAAQGTAKKAEVTKPATPYVMKAEAKPVTLSGEIEDLYCYMNHKPFGADHAACIKAGLPVAFVASNGSVYVVTDKDKAPVNTTVADFAGRKVTITGTVSERSGIKAIELMTIANATS
jgi:hypothetical protein